MAITRRRRYSPRGHWGGVRFELEGRITPAPFTPGNIVVYRVGNGVDSLVNSGAPVFIDEFNSNGTLVQSLPLPASGTGPFLIANGVSTLEGLLARSPNGEYLTLTGYNRALGGAGNVTSTTAGTVNRSVAVIDPDANINITTLSDFASASNPRSAVTTDGTNLWVSGGAGGVRFTSAGKTTSTQLSTTLTNLRQVGIADGQLYATTQSGSSIRLGKVGTGLPTVSGQTISNLPGFLTSTGNPGAFFFADLSPGVAGVDTLYVADEGADGLNKWSLVAGVWIPNGFVGGDSTNIRGITGVVSGTTVTLYGTQGGGSGATGGGQLFTIYDASGYNGAFAGTRTVLATAANNTAFRGVALAPTKAAVPLVSTIQPTVATTYETTASFIVTFTAPVLGVSASSFTATSSGTATAIVGPPTTGDNITWTVPVTSVSGSGPLRLDMTSVAGLSPVVGNLPFPGTGVIDVAPNLGWVAQGPRPITGGQVEGLGSQDSPVSGAVNAVLPHPTNPDLMYIGTVNGGVWRTTNATAFNPTWTPLTDFQASQSILELAIDPTDPAAQTIIAGIGRSSSFASNGGQRLGLLRTIDGGTSWNSLGSVTLADVNINGVAARAGTIVVSAANSVATGGVWRSTDAGLSFKLASGTGGLPNSSAYDLVEDPSDQQRLYVATKGGIFRTNDLGMTWTNVTPPGSTITSSTSAVELAVHAAGGTNAVYVGVVNSGRLSGIFRSGDFGGSWQTMDIPEVAENKTTALTDATNASPIVITSANHGLIDNDRVLITGVTGNTAANGTWTITEIDVNTFSLNGSAGNGAYAGGGTWQIVHGIQPNRVVGGPVPYRDPAEQPPEVVPDGRAGGQGNIHFSIAADPNNPNVVYLGGDRQPSPFPNAIGASNFTGRLFRGDASQAAGNQWTPLTHDFSSPESAPHADSREMAFDAAGNLIEGDDGGVYKRINPASTAGGWVALTGNLQNNETYPYGVAYDPLNNVFMAGAQDTGSYMQAAPNSPAWFQTNQGDGGAAAAAVIGSTSVRFHSSQNLGGLRRRSFDANNVQISNVVTARNVVGGGGPTGVLNNIDTMPFVTPVLINGQDPLRMVIASNNYVYESFDQADTLTRLNFGLEAGTVRSLTYGGPGNNDLLWWGGNTSGTELMVRTTAGGAFSLVSTFPGNFTRAISIDPLLWETAYVADLNNVVFRTTDAGATAGGWSNITGNLASAPGDIRSIVAFDNYVVVGKQTGVYFMRNSAPGVWHRLGGGLPTVTAMVVRYDATDDLLYVGTLGRGVWSYADASVRLADITAPTATITAVDPDPTASVVNHLKVTFSEPVNGLNLTDFTLQRDSKTLTLNPAVQTLATTNGVVWTLGNLAGLTSIAGTYTLSLFGAAFGVVDGVGNPLANSPSETFTFNPTPPLITGVDSPLPDATYLPNVAIPIAISFNEAVTVTGEPTLTMETGATDAVAKYVSGSGSSVLTFSFTSAHGQSSMDLEYVSTSALALNGGTIRNGLGVDAQVGLPAPGAAGSLSANRDIVLRPRASVAGQNPATVVAASFDQLDILFDQAMDITSFSFAADLVTFTGPGGDLSGALTAFAWPDAKTLRLTFMPQSILGSYHLVIGPQILSQSGANPLDLDADNTPGEPGDDDFSATVTLTDLLVSEPTDADDGNYAAGKLSLREALNLANGLAGANTITFAPSVFGTPQTINLTQVLEVSDALTITGPGSDLLSLDGGGTSRVFFINAMGAGNVVHLSGLRITGGFSGAANHGGGIFLEDEALILHDVVVVNNSASATGGGIRLQTADASLTATNCAFVNNKAASGTGFESGDGGALSVHDKSTVVLTACTISGNVANDDGAGIYFFNGGNLTLTACTVSGNTTALDDGAGLYGWAADFLVVNSTISSNISGSGGGGAALFNSTMLQLRNSTVAFNSALGAEGGGGVLVAAGTLVLDSTIVGKNLHPASPDVSGNATASRSLISDTAGATVMGSGNLSNIDPLLAPLASNGGPTMTHALLPGSPALNAGDNTLALANDQRGTGFLRSTDGQSDMGAFEFQVLAHIQSVLVNGAAAQRSRVTTIQVDFDQLVSLPTPATKAFQLIRQSDGAAVELAAAVTVDNATHVTLTFTGTTAVESGSLADGRYTLTVLALEINAGQFDGNADGTPGDNYVLVGDPAAAPKLYRLFGDSDGDNDVDTTDFGAFRAVFGGASNIFDFDNDGDVDTTDFGAFRGRFGANV